MSAYRVNALRRRPREIVSPVARYGLVIAGIATLTLTVALGLPASAHARVSGWWSASNVAANLLLCAGLAVAGATSKGARRLAGLVAATAWLAADGADWASRALAPARSLRSDCFDTVTAGIGASRGTSGGVDLLLFGIHAVAWLAICAVPYVWQRPHARPAWPSTIAAAVGLFAIGVPGGPRLHDGPAAALAFAALAFAIGAALRAGRMPTVADAAASVTLSTGDRAPDAAASDAFAAGPLRDAMCALVACMAAFAVETTTFGLLEGGMAATVITSLALLFTFERLRRRSSPRTSIVPVLAAATCVLLTVGAAMPSHPGRMHFMRDAAVLAFAVALFGFAITLPAPVAARRTQSRQLAFVIGAMALALLLSALLGLASSGCHSLYHRAPVTIFMGVLDGAALTIAIFAARRAASIEAQARIRIEARRLEDD